MNRIALTFFAFACAALFTTAAASAHVTSVDHGGTYFGDVVVDSGQAVDGDVTVLFGDAIVAGTVNGDVNVLGGTVSERPGAVITGRVNTLGNASAGDVLPWSPSRASMPDAFGQDFHVMWRIAWNAIVVLVFLIFPIRTRIALDRLERHPGLCAAVGLGGWIAVLPVLVLLVVTIVLIPLIPVEAAALLAGVFVGKAALALLIGRRLYEMVTPSKIASPLGALVIGLVFLTAAEFVPVLGGLVRVLIGLIGLGAAILTLVSEEHFAGPAAIGPDASPAIGGPPMTIA
jgi:hypothetical protein